MEEFLHKIYRFAGRRFREGRQQKFLDVCKPTSDYKTLDIGGLIRFWQDVGPVGSRIDLINLRCKEMEETRIGNCTLRYFEGDGRALELPDQSYDLVFSNSVIEHVGEWEDQVAFAREARRVGRNLWIQTPARSFFIEPHFMALFIHWLPKDLQKKLMRYISVWGWLTRPSKEATAELVDEIRLLTSGEMKKLFPDCNIINERFLGVFVKSYTAVRLDR